ncbi:FAD-dependent oxidoreductase [Actinoplanes friuliensis]|uniref:L-aspartate oxidase n=1 Tax=Actinoplanes friuliensis DSM 7358 TaxID=1246995 RepID=U5W147_9ACTN|nr:FAD-binding protein [Actinoplanes friuliensis]AGZ42737.1 FAD-dependent pyridine nucleotide-disulfide oxidoreductase [Actinoplanes friuliensis DSM 7358]
MSDLDLDAGVLVIGGGLAGTWTALSAATAGASVVLVDKGYCGTSGVTATAGVSHWLVPPEDRAAAIAERREIAGGLAEDTWMARVLEETWDRLHTLDLPFPQARDGRRPYRTIRGPEYLRAMRRLVKRAGVRILDHHPALELLADADGRIRGAAGIRRQAGSGRWRIRAGAVVLATGGCAFRSRLLGAHGNTGDGLLMAAEAGAELSGMELSSYYTPAPAFSSVTRSMSYLFGTYIDGAGREIDLPAGPSRTEALARALLEGPVRVRFDRMPPAIRNRMRLVQPNLMIPFDRRGIDPYTDFFEVTLRGEGTVRGVGGLRITSGACTTTVPGLWVAGDAAAREPIAGAISGGGAQNSAWAVSTGTWAGAAAAAGAVPVTDRRLRPLGRTGMRPSTSTSALDAREVALAVKDEMNPYDKNLFRTGTGLRTSLAVLDRLWSASADGLRGDDPVAAREAAALVAAGRWAYTSALHRPETRGLHRRTDRPWTDPALTARLHTGGLDRIWHRFVPVPVSAEVPA